MTLTSSNSYSERERTATLAEYVDADESVYLFGPQPSLEDLISAYETPRCASPACVRDAVAVSFGFATRGTGVNFHRHGPGFAE